ncbi:MAG: hypothetical protein ABSA17_05715 [Rhabdochlamydiaceae bacterium]
MEAVRPNPDFVIAQLNYLIQDPQMDSVINKYYNEARGRATIRTIAIAALTCVGYLYTRSYISLGIGALVLFINRKAGQHAIRTARDTDNATKQGRFEEATKGIKEVFQSGRASKQARGISALNGKDIAWNSDLLKRDPIVALKNFEWFYNGDIASKHEDIFGIHADPEVPTYRKILPIAKQFLSSKTAITQIKELQNEAYKFIYGYSSPNFNDTTLNSNVSVDDKKIKDKGYLDVSVVNDKIVAKAWVDTL